MINIQCFKVNKIILLISILRKSKDIRMSLLQDPRFRTLQDVVTNFTNHPEEYKKITEDANLMALIESEFFDNPSFTSAYIEAEEYKRNIESNWNTQKPIVEDYFKNVLGLTKNLNVIVNIVNPRWPTGTNDMTSEIFYGAKDSKNPEDESYGITYLVHESFHCYFPYEKKWNYEQIGICHSLIELAVDNELRKRLGKKDFEYGTLGHVDGRTIKKKSISIMEFFHVKNQTR